MHAAPDSTSEFFIAEPLSLAGRGNAVQAVAAHLADEMAMRWRRGERPMAEEILARHPELSSTPSAAAHLIYEEYCLRRELGESMEPAAILARFPQWADRLKVLLDLAKMLDPEPSQPIWPVIGDALGEFNLAAELGRGAVSRVYLASQMPLADRTVVLKVTADYGSEYLSLARLQHTHIVPLYSVQYDADRRLRILCMPYFGGATLDRLLNRLADVQHGDRTGADVLSALGELRHPSVPVSRPRIGTPTLASDSYVATICRIGASLADALHYAHGCGLVHLDLKPSNVLITMDGQPMLLDFHLAREPFRPGDSNADCLGGTVGYMSPEQQMAVTAMREGSEIATAVDHRSDIYSLGLILYQSLGGPTPLPAGEPPRLDRLNPRVPFGLAELIAKCLEPRPEGRYADAALLAGDLRRHLADLPLRGITRRSAVEEWTKWRRRRPHTLPFVVLALAVVSATVAVALVLQSSVQQRLNEARSLLAAGRHAAADHRYSDAVNALDRGVQVANSLPTSSEIRTELIDQLGIARQRQQSAELHAVTDQLRFLYASDVAPNQSLRNLEQYCEAVWQKRGQFAESPVDDTEPDAVERVRGDLLDLALLVSDLHVRLAPPQRISEARRDSLRILDEAERDFGSRLAISLARRRYTDFRAHPTDSPNTIGEGLGPRTAWERFLLGRFLFGSGDLDGAATEFDRAVAQDPGGFWPNFYAGVCDYRLGRHHDAVVAFTACIGNSPRIAGAYYNRALAYAATGRDELAQRDYDRALDLDANLVAARVNRGVLWLRRSCYDQAIEDLQRSLADGANPAIVQYNLALAHVGRHDFVAACASLRESLRYDSNQPAALELLTQLEQQPSAALAK